MNQESDSTVDLSVRKRRPEIRSLCLCNYSWECAKELAKLESRSISSLMRYLIIQHYKKKLSRVSS
jgi:hypothetical protein